MNRFRSRAFDVREVSTDRGRARLWSIDANIYVTEVSGHMTPDHARLFIQYADMKIAQSPSGWSVFHDWLDMTGYDSICRKELTSWSVSHLDAYTDVHVALRSKLVGMGVQVANIALRGIMHVHHSRASLEAALGRAIGR